MLLQSIISLSVIFVYIVFWILEKQISVAFKFFEDTMPGKQMAIDADLNSNSITETEANKKRKKLCYFSVFVNKSNYFVRNFFLIYTLTMVILLLLNTSFIIFNPDVVKVYSIILITFNILLFWFWIIFWKKIEKKIIA